MKKILPLLALSLSAALLTGAEPLFDHGKTAWKIVLGTRPSLPEEYAAKELSTALKKISGADFTIEKTDAPPTANSIVIGDLNNKTVAAKSAELGLKEGDTEQLAVRAADDCLYLAGNQPRGVLYAVYSFLRDDLGVRWLWAGADGEFMPKKDTWTLPDLNRTYTPALQYRGFHQCGDWNKNVPGMFRVWMARNFINIHRHGGRRPGEVEKGFHIFRSSHNAGLSLKTFREHPEYFGEFKGRRLFHAPCYSNDAVFELVCKQLEGEIQKNDVDILGLMAPDTQDFCGCEKCAVRQPSDIWFDFFNRLTDRMKEKYPKVKFSTIAYMWYRGAPQCGVRNAEFVEIATYDRCNIHPFGTPGCSFNEETTRLLDEWDKTSARLGNYGYEFDIFKTTVMYPFYSVLADAIRNEVKRGHKSMISEIILGPSNATKNELWVRKNRLGLYLYANLMWNPEKDLDEMLRDYCAVAFGAAADPMCRYFKLLDTAWTRNKRHYKILGGAADIIPFLLTDEVRKQVVQLFAEADKMLGGTPNDNVEYEKFLYSNLLALRLPKDILILPKIAESATGTGEKIPGCAATLSWNENGLRLTGIRYPFELMLSEGGAGETVCFSADSPDVKKTWKINGVGVREDAWMPEWTITGDRADIPFQSIGATPSSSSLWRIGFTEAGVRYPVESEDMAAVKFSTKAQPGKTVLWYNGGGEPDIKYSKGMDRSFLNLFWKCSFASEQDIMTQTPDVYWFRNPELGKGKLSAAVWEKVRENVKNGAAAFFMGFTDMEIDKYFQEPSFAIQLHSIGEINLGHRHIGQRRPGKWLQTPHDVARQARLCITPAYYYTPADESGWTVLLWMPSDAANIKPGVPMLMIRPYGKGIVGVLPANPARFSVPLVTGNILANLDELLPPVEKSVEK